MDEELKKELFGAVDESIKKNLEEMVGPQVAEKVEAKVKELRIERALSGVDTIDAETKKAFMEDLRLINAGEKAAHFTFSDQDGGYLVPTDFHNEILRIAATTGIIARDARKFDVGAQELEIPRYTGSVLQGEYLGEDEEGDETAVNIGVARLYVKDWQMIMRLSNNMIADARVNIVDWLTSLVGEGLAYRLDREGFVGGFTGSPFIGLLGPSTEVPAYTMATGATGFEDFSIAEASRCIAALPTSVLNGAGFYFHRTVWGELRARNTSGVYEYAQANSNLAVLRKDSGIQPVGEILGYPVYTIDVLPAYSSSAVSTAFGFFGDISKALAWADKGPMAIAKSADATVGGKSLFRSNQSAFRFNHRHGITQLLPTAGVKIVTAAS